QATARRAGAALEGDRDMLVSGVWPNVDVPEGTRPEVYVIASRREFRERVGERLSSAATSGDPIRFFFSGAPEAWEGRISLAVAGTSQLRYLLGWELASRIY